VLENVDKSKLFLHHKGRRTQFCIGNYKNDFKEVLVADCLEKNGRTLKIRVREARSIAYRWKYNSKRVKAK
jgi:hypothetical protein